MYAIIDTGGRQVRVQVGDVVRVDRRGAEVGEEVVFDRVLAVGTAGEDATAPRLGAPTVDGARVRGSVVAQGRARKIVVFTYKRRKNSSRKQSGHRQHFTAVKIAAIEG